MGGTAGVVNAGVLTAQDSLGYAMSVEGVATTIAGMESVEVLRQNLAVARGFQPQSATQMQALRDRCREYAADDRFELYKVSLKYDNPMTRMPHGFPIDGAQREIKDMLNGEPTLPGFDPAIGNRG